MGGEGARVLGGRWNPPSSYPTLYTALDPGTVALEVQRTAHKLGVTVAELLPRHLVTIRVSLGAILDLTDAATIATSGWTKAVVTDDDTRICQAIGDAAHYIGFEGILAPSAAGPGDALAIFINRLKPTSSLELIGKELLDKGDIT